MTSGISARTPDQSRLPRELGVWSALALTTGGVIGSGIFRVPASVAGNTGDATIMLLVWAVGGVIGLLGALSLAEMAVRFPRAGGLYVYLLETYGRGTAFVLGWTLLFLAPTALAALALVFAEYFGTLIAATSGGPVAPFATTYIGNRAVEILVLLVLAAANYRSVRWAGRIQNVSTIAKILTLVMLAAVAFAFGTRIPPSASSLAVAEAAEPGFGQYGLALIAVLWAYNGWQDSTAVSGEIRDPGRNLPRALIGGGLTVMAIYLLVNAAYLAVLPVEEIARSPLVASDVMTRVIGPRGVSVVSAMVMLSTFGALTGVVTTQPRYFFAMAEDGLFFRPLAAVHPRFQTPHVAIVFTTVVAIVFVTVRTFERLIETFVIGIWPFLALAVFAVILIRRRDPNTVPVYRTPGYPVVPLLFVAASIGLMAAAFIQQPISTSIGVAITLVGIPLYLARERWQKRTPIAETTR